MGTLKIPWVLVITLTLGEIRWSVAQNNPPRFTKTVYDEEVLENAAKGTTVLQVSAEDTDAGLAGDVTYYLQNSKYFDIIEGTGEIITNTQLNFENEDMRKLQEFTVVATDRGTPPRSADAQVRIQLLNENEHKPQFNIILYSANIQDEDPPGKELIKVTARDSDVGTVLTYSLPDPNPYFDIDAATGLITVNKTIDREAILAEFGGETGTTRLQLLVTVSDSHFLTVTKVFITVLKKNFFPPKFGLDDYSAEVIEETEGVDVVKVSATDGDNQDINFEILDPVLPDTFSINRFNGQIRLIDTIDRDKLSNDTLELKVLAVDDGNPPPKRTSTSTVRILVLDINDNAPRYSEPSFEIKMPQTFAAGEEISLPTATDADIGENAKIVYQLAPEDETYFILDSTSSKLTTRKACGNDCVKTVDCKWMSITVFTFNEGLPVPNNSLQVNVTLLTQPSNQPSPELVPCSSAPIPNDYAPVFSKPNYEGEVPENSPNGTVVVTVNTTDKDWGISAEVEYTITNSTDFGIKENGEIYTKKELDYENPNERTICMEVEAVDKGIPRRSNTTVVCVNVNNVNDNEPTFPGSYEATIRDGDPVDKVVIQMVAQDEDGTAGIIYELPDSNPYFQIDPVTGVISIAQTIDRADLLTGTTGDTIVIRVRANDNPFSVETQLRLTINISNEYFPVFTKNDYNTSVVEESSGDLILTVTAIDDDTPKQVIHYSLLNSDLSDSFSIGQTTGEIRVTKPIDREALTDAQKNGLELVVSVTDNGQPVPKTATTTVLVHVIDINDNVPSFNRENVTVRMSQTFSAGEVYGLPHAIDPDVGENAVVSYSLSTDEANTYFSVEKETGKLTTKITCDDSCIREMDCMLLKFSLVAVNENRPQENNTLSVNIITNSPETTVRLTNNIPQCDSISPPNKHDPEFTEETYTGKVNENSPPNTVVVTVNATDKDSGVSGNVTYTITNSTDFGINDKGEVYTIKDLDYENPNDRRICLEVEAKDHGTTPRKSTAVVCVDLKNLNDNPPTFPGTGYDATVSNGDPRGKFAIQITAADEDGTDGITYELPDANAYFQIDPNSGVITVAQTIDRVELLRGTTGDTITLTVRAEDGVHTVETSLRLTINISNEVAPVFTRDNYNTTVEENSSGQVILTVTATDEDLPKFPIHYSLLNSNMSDSFSIGQTTGEVRVTKAIDREALSDAHKNGLSLTVRATDNGLPEPKTVTTTILVHITDINDNVPKFSQASTVIRLPQIFSSGVVRDLPLATDPDLGENAVVSYSLSTAQANLYFAIEKNTGKITTKFSCDETCVRVMDCTLLEFSLVAVNENRPGERSTLTVTVVGDSPETTDRLLNNIPQCDNIPPPNKHDPKFTETKYEGEVNENSPPNTVVVTVNATDGDFGENGNVVYTITNSTDFGINDKGEIYTIKDLDFEDPNDRMICLEIEAKDNGTPPRKNTTVVCVDVKNLNDNPPIFPGTGYDVTISNSDPIGKVVIRVKATDEDGTDGISYELPDANPYFQIDSNTGVITVAKTIDRADILSGTPGDSITITVRAQDGVHTVDTQLRLTISISNDVTPVFTRDNYNTTVEEQSSGQVILTVTATDGDLPKFPIHYSLLNSDMSDSFSIGQTTGEIRVMKAIDREKLTDAQKNGLSLAVRVTDNGLPVPKTATTTILVHVTDINDNVPEFSQVTTVIRLPQLFSSGEVRDLPLATDPDLGENAVVSYSLSTAQANQYFTVEKNTGKITTKFSCDETCVRVTDCTLLEFSLVAVNENRPGKRNTLTVTVVVNSPDTTDRLLNNIPPCDNITSPNKHDPKFTETKYEGEVNENSPPNTVVVTVNATDGDFGENGNVVYTITNSTDFGINDKGEIYTIKNLDFEDPNDRTICLEVEAKDNGTPPRKATTVVCIDVKNLNDNPPVFPGTGYDATISNGDPSGKFVIQVKATDEDGTDGILYELPGANPYFQIDSNTGVITVAKIIDRVDILSGTPGDSIILTVRARDGEHIVDTQLRLTINISNEVAPVFTRDNYNTTVEEQSSGQVILTVTATDGDLPKFPIHYSLLNSDMSDSFSIGQTTGEIRVTTPIDREALTDVQKNGLELIISVTDNGLPEPKTATTIVLVHVTDINDNAPLFNQVDATIRLPQRFSAGEVYDLPQATDKDIGENAVVSYSLSNSRANQYFSIEKDTGKITTKFSCDETCVRVVDCTLLKLSLVAFNENRPQMRTTLVVDVIADSPETTDRLSTDILPCDNILPPNKHEPKFTETKYEGEVNENSPPNTVVVTVNATDGDFGDNGDVEYTITNSTDFGINDKGEIYTIKDLDFEDPNDRMICLEIEAKDNGTPPRKNTTVVCVEVKNLNDNPPTFPGTGYDATISNGDPRGKFVIQITAADEDGTDGILYELPAANPFFQINSTTGTLTVSRKINKAEVLQGVAGDTIILTVRARDSVYTTDTQLRLTIDSTNEYAPVFTEVPYNATVVEESSGVELLRLTAIDDDIPRQNIRYHLLQSDMSANFSLDESTGALMVAHKIDREILSAQNTLGFQLSMTATDDGLPSPKTTTVTVEIKVQDINDNIPLFDTDVFEVRLSQTYSSGEVRQLPVASDKDVAENAKIVYKLSDNADEFFTLDKDTGQLRTKSDCDKCVRLSNCRLLQFTVWAYNEDRANLANSLEVSVVLETTPPTANNALISCLNATAPNYYDPVFPEKKYEGNLTENTLPDTVIFVVNATDKDWGDSGDVTYELTNSTDFRINENGEIITVKVLDYETPEDRYKCLEVLAVDKGIPQRSATTVVCLDVVNENDNRPEFTELLYTATVQDGVAQGTWVIQVTATDKDPDSVITYDFSTPNTYFHIDAQTGNVTAARTIDRQDILRNFPTAVVVLTLRAKDSKYLVARQLRVTITRRNQFAPNFTRSIYDYAVNEETSGVPVGSVLANDLDVPRQAIEYRIVSSDIPSILDAFSIDQTSGQIVLLKEIDRESLPRDLVELIVEAADSGDPPPKRSSSATVRIAIRDINDHIPLFNNPSTELRLFQNYSSGEVRVMPTATDADISDTIVYELSSNVSHLFTINKFTGVITTLTQCEDCRRLGDCHLLQFIIWAYNEDKPQAEFRSTLQVSLTLLTLEPGTTPSAPGAELKLCSEVDRPNDHYPQFSKPNYDVDVDENSPPNTVIVIISTTDGDLDNSGKVEYRITNSTDFGINKTGEIYTIKDLDYENPEDRHICVEVVATDKGNPPKSNTTVVCVNVVNLNDNPPKFPPQVFRANVEDGGSRGSYVITITATDDDPDSEMTYTFPSSNPYFQIDSKSGNVSVSQTIDIEDIVRVYGGPLVRINVRASDSKYIAETALEINIVRKNDHDPEFSQTIYDATVNEETSNVLVVQVSATDDDLSTEVIQYQILNSSIPGIFSMDGNTGDITLISSVDRESLTSDIIEVLVVAVDSGVPPPKRTSTATVRVQVLDINDHVPEFNVPSFDLRIYQNFSQGDVFELPKAVDQDSGDTVLYELSQEANSFFTMNTNTGNVQTRTNCGESCVKLEDCRRLEFTVWAYNQDKPAERGVLRVNITLLTTATEHKIPPTSDVPKNCPDAIGPNKHDPKFTQTKYEGNVTENSPPGTVVAVVNSTDGDPGKSGEVEYRITNSTDFNVNENGEITTTKPLDYEKTNGDKICVEVIAVDKGRPTRTATAVVCVEVVNLNDNKPVFTSQMTASVQDGALPSTLVTTITARDDDPDSVITYEFATPSEYFHMDRATGKVTVAKAIDRADIVLTTGTSVFSLRVIASDSQNQQDGQLVITVSRKNEYPPEFSQNEYTAIVDEEATSVHVIRVEADDQDLPKSPVIYMIPHSNISDHFTINPNTGDITLIQSFDRESLSEDILYLEVVAVDTGRSPPRSSTATVKIRVADINDHTPHFVENPVEIRLLQNFTAGEIRQLPIATDLDVGENGRVIYQLSPGIGNYFIIDDNAKLTTRRGCGRDCFSDEEYLWLVFTVSAFNNGRPEETDKLQVKVILLPVDYVVPPITGEVQEKASVEVNRNYAKPGDSIYDVPVRQGASKDNMAYYMSAVNDNETLAVFDVTEDGKIVLKYVPTNRTKYFVKFLQSENGERNITYTLEVTFIDETHLDDKGIAAITAICLVILLIIILIIVHLIWWKTRHKKEKETRNGVILENGENGSSGADSDQTASTGFNCFKPVANYKYNNHESEL